MLKQRIANLLRTSMKIKLRFVLITVESANINSFGELVARDEQDLLNLEICKNLSELNEVTKKKSSIRNGCSKVFRLKD